MTDYVRGQAIRFAATFTDADGAAFTPTAPVIVIEFPHGRKGRSSTTRSLEVSGSSWSATWNSSEADRAGKVYWAVYTDTPAPAVAAEGEFNLTANAANLVAV